MSDTQTEPRAWLSAGSLGDVEPWKGPGKGWPEFSVTLDFYVDSDDPAVVEAERQRVWDALPDLAIEATDGDIVRQLARCGDGTAESPWLPDELVKLAKLMRDEGEQG